MSVRHTWGGPRRAWRLLRPGWHQDLLAPALIILTVAAGCLLALIQAGR